MSTTITLTKVEPYLGGEANVVPATGSNVQGAMYRYEFLDNSTPPKKGVLIFPTASLLTPGNNSLSGTNTGTIVITDTPG